MKKRNFLAFILMLVGLLVLAACGGENASDSDSSSDSGGDSSSGGSVSKARIAIGPPASGTNSLSKIILPTYGLEEGDYDAYQEGFGDAADLLQDGNIDISFGILGLPAGSIESLQATTGDVKLLGLSEEAIAELEANTGYQRFTIPAGSYDFQEEDVETVAAYAVLVGNTDTIDEDLAYELARIMVEHSDEITHAQGSEMTLENALNGAEGLPIHPGAKRYYEEQGLTVDNPVAEVSADASNRKSEFTLGTGSQGGTYYPLGGEIANVWNNYLDENFTNMETGASVENLALIGQGEIDLGMTVHVPALEALNGEGDFEGTQIENFAFIGHIYPEVLQIITRETTGITSLDDLKK